MPVESTVRSTATSICRQCRRRILHQLSQRGFASQAAPAPISVSNESGQHDNDMAKSLPRWAQTPPAMKAPYKSRPLNDNDDYPVNEDPKVLDNAYKQMLGQDGERVLTEEIKWLAVTHKSFDHGRRGFNDRLAFLGKRIVTLHTSLALLEAPPDPSRISQQPDHAASSKQSTALFNVENVNEDIAAKILSDQRLAGLGKTYNLHTVIRWKPRLTRDLDASGQTKILAQTLYAIVGAVALQRGGEEAKRIVRQRILSPLGL